MKAPDCDKGQYIKNCLGNLNDLKKLQELRHEYWLNYNGQKDYPLTNYIILGGRYLLGHTSGFIALKGINVPEKFPLLPEVITKEQFDKILGINHYTLHYYQALPSDSVKCPICHTGWSLYNLHNLHWIKNGSLGKKDHFVRTIDGNKIYNLNEHAREHFNDVKESFAKRADAVFSIPREKNILVFTSGRVSTDSKREFTASDNYLVQKGDYLDVDWHVFYHKDCYAIYHARQYTKKYNSTLKKFINGRFDLEITDKHTFRDYKVYAIKISFDKGIIQFSIPPRIIGGIDDKMNNTFITGNIKGVDISQYVKKIKPFADHDRGTDYLGTFLKYLQSKKLI